MLKCRFHSLQWCGFLSSCRVRYFAAIICLLAVQVSASGFVISTLPKRPLVFVPAPLWQSLLRTSFWRSAHKASVCYRHDVHHPAQCRAGASPKWTFLDKESGTADLQLPARQKELRKLISKWEATLVHEKGTQGRVFTRVKEMHLATAIAAWLAYLPMDFAHFRLVATYDADGFFAAIFVSSVSRQVVLAFRGTRNIQDVLFNLSFSISDLFDQAFVEPIAENALNHRVLHVRCLCEYIAAHYPVEQGWEAWTTGHSLGGVYATLAGMMYRLHGYTFNSPGVSRSFWSCKDFVDSSQSPIAHDPVLELHDGQRFENHVILGDLVCRYPWGSRLGPLFEHFRSKWMLPREAHHMSHFLKLFGLGSAS
ncbi:MAG: hypothetical protein OXT67_02025 [Zetaproteobacteria bacterium]|nr:hypothetical protein [Zetaproteobacteria bacterium]